MMTYCIFMAVVIALFFGCPFVAAGGFTALAEQSKKHKKVPA